MTTVDKILKREGIVKYNGKLIYPDERIGWWFNGVWYGSVKAAKEQVDKLKGKTL